MSADRPIAAGDVAPDGRKSRSRYAIQLAGVVLAVSIAAVVIIQPRVGPWLEVRSAYRNLASEDYDARIDAVRRLRRLGENPESELIALLHHPDENIRRFAANSLANGPRVTDSIIEAFLVALETDQHAADIGDFAPNLFAKHANDGTGRLTETDGRIIAWLRRELSSANPDRRGKAAFALAAFANRDPSLNELLAAYLKNTTFFYQYVVLREMVRSDPSLRDQYVDVLLSGLAGSVPADQLNALYGLTHMQNEPDNLRTRLEARRAESTNPGEISRIDQALESLGAQDTDSP